MVEVLVPEKKISRVAEMSRQPGVADLPLKIRGLFAIALIAESDGDMGKAEEFLAKAVLAEEELAKAKN